MPRGSKPGERRGGREKGTPNKATAAVKTAAGKHGPAAIKVLASIMSNKESPEAARVAAANAILDRWAGKPPQAITGDDGGPLVPLRTVVIHKFLEGDEHTDA